MKPRTLPHSLSSEASVLGGIMFRNEVLKLLPDMEVEDFYSPKHQAVFAAIRNLEATAKPIDPITLEVELERQGKLESIGGLAFLAELYLQCPSVDNVLEYARIVKHHRVTVKLAQAASVILERCMEPDEYEDNHGKVGVEKAISELMSIDTGGRHPGRTVGELMRMSLANIERDLLARDRGEKFTIGVPIGITSIDEKMGGQPIGVVTALYGGSGHGKSTFMMNAARAAAAAEVISIIYSFEDSEEFAGDRALAQESGVPTESIVARNLDGNGHVRRLGIAAGRTHLRTEIVVPAAGWTIDDVIADAIALRHAEQARIGGPKRRCAIYIDYIQVVKMSRGFGPKEKPQAIAYMMDRLQWLAQGAGSGNREERFAVMVASQVKPEVTKERRAPTAEDWVDSASIKTVSKIIFGINRPATYDDKADPMRGSIDVLKRNQGDPNVHVDVELDLTIHTIRDFKDPYPEHLTRRP